MEAGRLRLARNEQAMGFARPAEPEHDHALAGLVDLLNMSVNEHRHNLDKHPLDILGAQRHVLESPEVNDRR